MLFPTVDFAIFFVLVFTGHWLLNHLSKAWKWFMIGASYVFYAWWDWRFVLLLVGISVLAQLGAIACEHETNSSSGSSGEQGSQHEVMRTVRIRQAQRGVI